jgi:hypothetical protein
MLRYRQIRARVTSRTSTREYAGQSVRVADIDPGVSERLAFILCTAQENVPMAQCASYNDLTNV